MGIKQRIWILVTVIILIVAASLAGIFYISRSKSESRYVEIYRDDQLLQRVDMSNVKETMHLRFDYGEDDYNIVEITSDYACIIEASCPDLLCQKLGEIHNGLMPITCLPNHLIIRLVDEEEELDGVVY